MNNMNEINNVKSEVQKNSIDEKWNVEKLNEILENFEFLYKKHNKVNIKATNYVVAELKKIEKPTQLGDEKCPLDFIINHRNKTAIYIGRCTRSTEKTTKRIQQIYTGIHDKTVSITK